MCNNCQQMFNDWLLKELKQRDWLQADLARASGLTTAAISRYINGRAPEETSIKKIARAFNLPPEIVFRAAGILPPATTIDEETEQIIFEASKLNPQDRAEVIAFIRMKQNLRKKK